MSTAVETTKLRVVPPTGTATLAKALIAASKEFKPVVKDSKNPHFGNAYASLGAYIDATKPALTAHGLAVVQRSLMVEQDVCLETIILHESGETFQAGLYPLRPVKGDPQGFGSAMTYARRYCYAAALNLASEDDDGSDASKSTPERKPAPAKKADPIDGLSSADIKEVMDAAHKRWGGKGYVLAQIKRHVDALAKGLHVESLEAVKPEHKDAILDAIANGSDPAK